MSRSSVFLIGMVVGMVADTAWMMAFGNKGDPHAAVPPGTVVPFTTDDKSVRYRFLDGTEVIPVAMGRNRDILYMLVDPPPAPVNPPPAFP